MWWWAREQMASFIPSRQLRQAGGDKSLQGNLLLGKNQRLGLAHHRYLWAVSLKSWGPGEGFTSIELSPSPHSCLFCSPSSLQPPAHPPPTV